jgi:hypothetical protein
VARLAGLDLCVEQGQLAIRAPFGAPPAVVDALRTRGPEIVALLIPGPGGRTPQDWLAEFDERAAVLEHNQGLSRLEAEARTFDVVLNKYLDATPPNPARGSCSHCRCGDLTNNPLIPHGGDDGTHGWPVPLHTSCFQSCHSQRRADAAARLKSWGLRTDNSNYAPF